MQLMERLTLSITLVLLLLTVACGASEQTATPQTPSAAVSPTPSDSPAATSGPSKDGSPRKVYESQRGSIHYIEWSPDGENIALTEDAYAGLDSSPTYYDVLSVVVVSLDGLELARIPHASLAHWSPDGSRLSILSEFDAPPSRGDIISSSPAVVTLATGALQPLANHIWTYDAPRWDPTGQSLVYASPDTGVNLVTSDGTTTRVLLEGRLDGALYLAPTWSVSGKILAFERPQNGATINDAYVVTDASGQILKRTSDERPGKCGREWFLRDAEAEWIGNTTFAAWPPACQSPAGIRIKDVVNASGSRFIDLSKTATMNEGLVDGFLDVHPNTRSLVFANVSFGIGIGPRQAINPDLAGRWRIYQVAIADGQDPSPQLLIENGREPIWRPTQ